MLSFESDYIEGAHPRILERLHEINLEKLPGYGADRYCESAREKIRNECRCPGASVHFLTGGTQTNSVTAAALLRGYEGVIAAKTGHIALHEAGAIERTGHKVTELPQHEGRLDSGELGEYLAAFHSDANRRHMTQPGMVYISHPTEYGTLYTKAQLTALASLCREYSLPLYMDGARLGYALMSPKSDLSLADIARLCDIFYIGGTKVGALFGEALVFTKNNVPPHFMTTVKQHGALLAKGWLTGVQFDTLFTDRLYFEIGAHAVGMAQKMRDLFRAKGYELYLDAQTNQIFIILDNARMEKLASDVGFCFWEKAGEHRTVVRFAASFATTQSDVDALGELL